MVTSQVRTDLVAMRRDGSDAKRTALLFSVHCWLVEKPVRCMRELCKRTSLWTSGSKPALFRTYTTGLFKCHQLKKKPVTLRVLFPTLLFKSKLSKSELKGRGKLNSQSHHFWKCADAVCQKESNCVRACRKYSLPKLALFTRATHCVSEVFAVAMYLPGCLSLTRLYCAWTA